MAVMAIFKAYDIRGIVPDELDAKMAYGIGRAVAHFIGKGVIPGAKVLNFRSVGVARG